jgi:hypothetical protein
MCGRIYMPVCGADDKTYSNACEAECQSVEHTDGACDEDDGCVCTEEYMPVCGADGETYGNVCGARCAGVESSTKGECSNETANDEEEDRTDDDFDIAEACPDQFAGCTTVEACQTFLDEQEKDDDKERGGVPSDAEVAAVGPEAVALLKCYMDAMFTPERLTEMVEGIVEMVSMCAAENITASAVSVSAGMQCALDCAATHDAIAIASCAVAAGTDSVAVMACSADLTACTTGCATGARGRRDNHRGTGGGGGDGNGGGQGDGNGGRQGDGNGGGPSRSDDDIPPCAALARTLNELPSLCNRQRRDAHTAAICAAMATAKTGLKAAADAGVEGDFTVTSDKDEGADGGSGEEAAEGGADGTSGEEAADGFGGSSTTSFAVGVATSFAAVLALVV